MRVARLVWDWAHWLVVPIALLLLFPSTWMPIGFVAALGLFFCRWKAMGSPVPVSRANLPLLVLLSMLAVGLLVSSSPDLAVITAAQVTAGVTLFFVLVDHLYSPRDLWRIAAALVTLGILFALVAPFTVNLEIPKYFRLPQAYVDLWPRLAKITNSNIVAGALAPIVPIALALIVQSERRGRVLGAVSLAPLLGMLVLLQSRGAIFALAVGLAVWVTLYWRWALPVLPIGLALLLLWNGASSGVPAGQFLYGAIETTSSLGTFIQRQDMWVQSLYLIRSSPLVGIGLGAFPHVASVAWPYSAAQPGPVYNHAHNLFLQVALDTGIFGLGAFAVLLGLAAREAWRAYRREMPRTLAIGLLAGLVVVVVHGFGDVIVWGTAKSSVVLWILLALAFGFAQFGVQTGRGYNASEILT